MSILAKITRWLQRTPHVCAKVLHHMDGTPTRLVCGRESGHKGRCTPRCARCTRGPGDAYWATCCLAETWRDREIGVLPEPNVGFRMPR